MNTTALAAAPAKAKQRFTYQCPACGSSNIISNATARWSDTKQEFVLDGIHDFVFCRACEHEDDSGNSFFKKLEG